MLVLVTFLPFVCYEKARGQYPSCLKDYGIMTSYYSRLALLEKSRIHEDVSTSEFRAGVAVLIRPDDHVCMIRRAVKEGDYWSGHMGFPGGREELQDRELLETAIRETKEEIGVDILPEQCMGRLSDLNHPKLQVAAFVFRSGSNLEFILEESEVAEVHWLPLHGFTDVTHRSTRVATYKGQEYEAPVVNIGTADVWGISLRFIEDLIRRLDS